MFATYVPTFGIYFMIFDFNKRLLCVSDQDRQLNNCHGLTE